MSSQSGEGDEIRFTGQSAEEAEDFISAVNRRAWAAGKQKDFIWMAEFAYSCFTKKALRWYEELDEDTQNDWRLLKRSILASYRTPEHSLQTIPSSAPAPRSVSAGSTPAAAPPIPTVRIGRVRLDSRANKGFGYIELKLSGSIFAPRVSESRSDAGVFEVDMISRTIKFQEGKANLSIRAYRKGWSLEPGAAGPEYEFGALFKSSEGAEKPTGWVGTEWDDVWSIAPDGKVVATLTRSDGSRYNLEATTAVNNATVIYLSADSKAFINSFKSAEYHSVTLFFESLS